MCETQPDKQIISFQDEVHKHNEDLVIQIASKYDDFISSKVYGATNYICNDEFESLIGYQDNIASREVCELRSFEKLYSFNNFIPSFFY